MTRVVIIVVVLFVLVAALLFWRGAFEKEPPGQPSPHALDQSK